MRSDVVKMAILLGSILLVSACQTGSDARTNSGETDRVDARENVLAGELVEGVPVDSEVCSGNLVPPTGHRQETAFVPLTTENAIDVAAQTARARLRDLICQGYRCEQAEEITRIWRVGHDGRRACVMAVARESRIREFESGPRQALEEGLIAVARTVAESLNEVVGDGGMPTVFIDAIADNGVNGGPRAEWLHDRLLLALAQQSVTTISPPPKWTGLGVPGATTGILRGTIRELPGQEALLEVSWQLALGNNRVRGVGNVEFPQAISPEVDPETYMPPLPRGSGKIALHIDSRPGGALCDGQQTELWLESSEPVHVRVINLYGRGEGGLVIYATEEEPLAANYPVSLGQFQAVKATDVPVERFIVIAAPTVEELGRFSSIGQACRLPGSVAQSLHHGQQLPAEAMEWITSLDYRLMSGEECEDVRPAGRFDLATLNQLPTCW